MAIVSERSAALPVPGTSAIPERSALIFLMLFIGFAVVAASLYGSVLTAPFVSDDYGYIVSHPDTESVDSESVRKIFDPWGTAKLYSANYAPVHLLLDAAVHEPKGSTAAFMRARRAAEDGEVAVGELRLAADLGVVGFMALPQDPGLAPLREEPAFKALVHELAGRWITRARARGYSSQPELRLLGIAHLLREEYREAVKAFRAAIEVSGRLDAVLAAELEDALFLESSVQVRGSSERATH